MAEPRAVRYTDIVAAKKTVIGSSVVNAQNEDLGKIEDLVLDAGAGRIAYAVLSFGGFLGMGDKYFAIPSNAFHFNLKDNRAVLDLDIDSRGEASLAAAAIGVSLGCRIVRVHDVVGTRHVCDSLAAVLEAA